MKAIITKFVHCTDTKGARIKASTGRGGQSILISYPHELNADQAHRYAAEQLCKKMNWPGNLIDGGLESGESVFVFEPRSREQLYRAALECLPDLRHYVATHGPGPDRRLEALQEALEAYTQSWRA